MAITTAVVAVVSSYRGFKHHPEVSLDILGQRLKVSLRMATLIAAWMGGLGFSLSSFLPLACKSLPVLTLD